MCRLWHFPETLSLTHVKRELFVSQLQYTVSKSEQRDVMDVDMVRESNFSMRQNPVLQH